MTVLAVDAGRTHCRVAVMGQDRPVAGPVVRDSGVSLADPDGAARLAERIRAAIAALPPVAPPEALVVAAAGGLTRPEAAARLADLLADLAPARVMVTSDVVAAHAGAFAGEAGVVLAVGTGAVALAVAPDGRHALVDGGGWLVGDDGSGFSIGRAGLAAALRHVDGRPGGSATLAEAAVAQFAPGAGVRQALAALYADPAPARVASFAPSVAAAARAGDPAATGIWRQAVAHLASTVHTAVAALPDHLRPTVTVTGALSEVEDLLVAPLRARLADHVPPVRVRTGETNALVGAATLARLGASAYRTLVYTQGGNTGEDSTQGAGLDERRGGAVAHPGRM